MKTLLKVAAGLLAGLILVVGAFGGGVWFERTVTGVRSSDAASADLEDAVREVAGIIEDKALEPSSEASMTAGAISGMLESLEDSHAAYFDPRHYEYFNEMNDGVFYGIGVTIAN